VPARGGRGRADGKLAGAGCWPFVDREGEEAGRRGCWRGRAWPGAAGAGAAARMGVGAGAGARANNRTVGMEAGLSRQSDGRDEVGAWLCQSTLLS
jgi:hypothetical protein